MDSEILRRKDFSLLWFTVSFALTIVIVKLSSLLAQFGLYFYWSSLFEPGNDASNLWLAAAVRFLIPFGVGLILGISLPLTMRSSVTAGALFSALFLVWPTFGYFDLIVDPQLAPYKGVFFFFYALELVLFSTAAYGGFSLGGLLSPLLPRFELAQGERIKISIAKHILLPGAIALAGNIGSSAALRSFLLGVLGAK